MGSLVHLLFLALVVSAAIAQPQRGGRGRGGRRGRRPQAPNMDQLFETMKESGCLPEDFTKPDYSECESLTNPRQKLQCAATSSGISGDSGYDQAGAETHIDSLSEDEEWRSDQKELLETCEAMMPEELPAEQQGAFMMACSLGLTVVDCNKQRLQQAAAAVDPENGEEVAEYVAAMAEGHCFKRGLKYQGESKQQWEECATEAGVDKDVLKSALMYYKALAMGSEELPALTAENVTAVAAELEKLESAVDCYTLASGVVTTDGEINYEKITADIESARGRAVIKEAAKEIVTMCQNEEPETIDEFHECYFEAQGYACTALKSYTIASGRGEGRGRGRRGRQG